MIVMINCYEKLVSDRLKNLNVDSWMGNIYLSPAKVKQVIV